MNKIYYYNKKLELLIKHEDLERHLNNGENNITLGKFDLETLIPTTLTYKIKDIPFHEDFTTLTDTNLTVDILYKCNHIVQQHYVGDESIREALYKELENKMEIENLRRRVEL